MINPANQKLPIVKTTMTSLLHNNEEVTVIVDPNYFAEAQTSIHPMEDVEDVTVLPPHEPPNTTGEIPLVIPNSDPTPGLGEKRKISAISTASIIINNSNNNRRTTPSRVSWEDRIQQLNDYKVEFGDLAIPIRYKRNPSLGKFVHNTREQYKLFHNKTKAGYKKKCSLTAERITELEGIGFLWSTERGKKQEEDWEKRMQQLKDYKKEHGVCKLCCFSSTFIVDFGSLIACGYPFYLFFAFSQDCLVPHGYESDPSFAEWVHRQRTTYAAMLKEDEPSEIIMERMKKLQEIDFNFTVHTDKWMEYYEQLKLYKEKHGDCQVPTHYSDNPKLGRWTHTQRHQRRLKEKGKRSCMTQERIHLLDQLGFSWEVRPAFDRPRATWQQRFDELRAYHMEHGDFLIDVIHDPILHAWAYEQRNRIRNIATKGKDASRRMGPDRVESLARIDFTKDVELLETSYSCRKEGIQQRRQHWRGETVDSVAAKLLIPDSVVVATNTPPEVQALADQVVEATRTVVEHDDTPLKWDV